VTFKSFTLVITALNDANIRYLVVGGVAVNAHGYVRMTIDVDILMQLEPHNIIEAMKALAKLGYQPTIPVTPEQFADASNRERWINDKKMKVLKLSSDEHRETTIDIFVSDPLGFDDAYERAHMHPIAENLQVPVCSYDDLVKLKIQASRPRDLVDLAELKKVRGEK
jgi:predicted nucleotidyltransferase